MGFYSYDCKHCNKAVINCYTVDPEINAWMADVVVLTPYGSVREKNYEGYGVTLEDEDGDEIDCCDLKEQVWVHYACWVKHGKPAYESYGSPSEMSDNQGYFFDARDYWIVDPRIEDPVHAAQIRTRIKLKYEYTEQEKEPEEIL